MAEGPGGRLGVLEAAAAGATEPASVRAERRRRQHGREVSAAPLGSAFDRWFAQATAVDPSTRHASPSALVESLSAALGRARVGDDAVDTDGPTDVSRDAPRRARIAAVRDAARTGHKDPGTHGVHDEARAGPAAESSSDIAPRPDSSGAGLRAVASAEPRMPPKPARVASRTADLDLDGEERAPITLPFHKGRVGPRDPKLPATGPLPTRSTPAESGRAKSRARNPRTSTAGPQRPSIANSRKGSRQARGEPVLADTGPLDAAPGASAAHPALPSVIIRIGSSALAADTVEQAAGGKKPTASVLHRLEPWWHRWRRRTGSPLGLLAGAVFAASVGIAVWSMTTPRAPRNDSGSDGASRPALAPNTASPHRDDAPAREGVAPRREPHGGSPASSGEPVLPAASATRDDAGAHAATPAWATSTTQSQPARASAGAIAPPQPTPPPQPARPPVSAAGPATLYDDEPRSPAPPSKRHPSGDTLYGD